MTAMKQYTQTELLFDSTDGKKVVADFTGGRVTSDAGLLLVRAVGRGMRLFERAASALNDRRRAGSVEHSIEAQLRQRVYQICAGYFHAVDCNRLRDDPMFKVVCERSALDSTALAGQSTQSRLENSVSRTDQYRLAGEMLNIFMDSYRKVPKRIVLDIDDTCDPTHGAQQLTLFNAHDDTYCYRPLHIYEGDSGKLVTAVLRPGKRPSGQEAAAILRRVLVAIRSRWPRTRIHVRGDSHFGCEQIMALCESMPRVTYTLAMAKNAALERLLEQSYRYERGHRPECSFRHYEAFDYAAGSWSRSRRTIARLEVKNGVEDVRYILTNIVGGYAAALYEKVYCKRGQAENWIKDHKNALRSDLTSCHRFEANQFRVLLHSLAYMVLHEFRARVLRRTELARAQMDTIRWRLLKIGAQVTQSARRIRFHLAAALQSSPLLQAAYANLDTA
jgi:hypothetical protein